MEFVSIDELSYFRPCDTRRAGEQAKIAKPAHRGQRMKISNVRFQLVERLSVITLVTMSSA